MDKYSLSKDEDINKEYIVSNKTVSKRKNKKIFNDYIIKISSIKCLLLETLLSNQCYILNN